MATARGKVIHRSGFEQKLRAQLDEDGVAYKYEPESFVLRLKVPGHQCNECGSKDVGRDSRYTPDFLLTGPDLFIEAKGKFTAKDRKRCLAFHEQFGHLRYAIVFMRNNRLTKGSETYYTDWALKHGIPCAVGSIPEEWYA